MIGALKRGWASFRGFDLTGSTVPPMDGPLRPNSDLDAAPMLIELDEVDNLVATTEGAVCSVGERILKLAATDGGLQIAATRHMAGRVTAMAAAADRLAIAVEGAGILLQSGGDEPRALAAGSFNVGCVTAMSFAGPDTLYLAVGSTRHGASDWKRDLMTRSATGEVWRIDIASGGATRLAEGLAFPSGIFASGGRVFVSEAWRHRVVAYGGKGAAAEVVLGALPAYPGRIAAASGGFWLAMFAPRNPLVEFVLKEDAYRDRMVATIDPAYWIAPSLVTGRSFLEPIQGGARKKLNRLKPWSPAWSTGLVVRCDGAMQMLRSHHSRADGHVHGVTSLCEIGGRLLVGAKGSGKIVAIDDNREPVRA